MSPAQVDERGVGARTPALVAPLLLLGAVVYLSWVLAPWVAQGGLDPVTTYASELAATDQPGSWFFRVADMFSGALLAAVGLIGLLAYRRGELTASAVLRQGPWRERWEPIGWIALVVFGLATVADASSPLSCAPSADKVCAAREAAFEVPWTHLVHVGTSVTASLGMLAAIIALTWCLAGRRGSGVPSDVVFWLLVVCAAGNIIGTTWTMLEVSRASVDWPWPGTLGIAQRLQVGSASLWLMVLALVIQAARTFPRQEE